MYATQDLRITLPELVSRRADERPEGIFARIPVGPAYSDGFKDVTNMQLHNAVNSAIALLLKTYGKSNTFETLAYIGPTDLRYFIIMLAGIKTDYKVSAGCLQRCNVLTMSRERSSCPLRKTAW